jgi:hypothetical protein
MKKFNLIDYKGKYYLIQDQEIEDDMDFVVGVIRKDEALKKEFARNHRANCRY